MSGSAPGGHIITGHPWGRPSAFVRSPPADGPCQLMAWAARHLAPEALPHRGPWYVAPEVQEAEKKHAAALERARDSAI